ncbi:Dihydroneopterin aldolase-domain-containing protein [Nemania serpens]|nr:Dihydroneopterin aldolase-domain-containing protein [Nemania serpens]
MASSEFPRSGTGTDPTPDSPAPLVSTWQVRAEAGEPQAIVRVSGLHSVTTAGKDAWGRAARLQPVLLSSEVSFARPFESASVHDAVNAETVHYGSLSKTLLRSIEYFSSPSDSSKNAAEATAGEMNNSIKAPRTAEVLEVLWVTMTGRITDGSLVALPMDQVPFLDATRLRSLSLTLYLPKASLVGSGVSLGVTACFHSAADLTDETKKNPLRSYARSLQLHSLQLPTLIGVNPNERTAKQAVIVDVDIDRFDVDEDIYPELEATVVRALGSSCFETLEALGTYIGNHILDEFRIGDNPQPMRARGWQIRVCIKKPIAVPFAECPSVEVRVGQ